MFDQLHQDHFKVVLHVAYPTGIREMHGTAEGRLRPEAARRNAGRLLLGYAPSAC